MTINTPIADKLYQLIGSPPSSLDSVIENHEPTISKLSNYTYYAYKPLGVSFCFISQDDQLVLDAIDVYNGATRDGFSPCTFQDLPCGIKSGMQAHEIVSMLGEPDRKGGGGQSRLPCWIEYKFKDTEKDSGILIQLHGFEWEDREMGWTSFVLF